jgi:hypothetical protein
LDAWTLVEVVTGSTKAAEACSGLFYGKAEFHPDLIGDQDTEAKFKLDIEFHDKCPTRANLEIYRDNGKVTITKMYHDSLSCTANHHTSLGSFDGTVDNAAGQPLGSHSQPLQYIGNCLVTVCPYKVIAPADFLFAS